MVGVVLVLVSAALGARLVASADDRAPYFVAADDLVAGDEVTAASFRRVEVALSDGMGQYVRADAPAPEGQLLTRDLRAGELVPTSALGSPGELDLQRVTVRADAVSAAGLDRGQRVDVYVTPDSAVRVGDGEKEDVPGTARLLRAVAVVNVLANEGGLGAAAQTSVQLYVPADQVMAVVEAVDHDAKITLVPVSGAGGGARDA
ncbi:SAF domain-containing protein [Intrasporangium sp. DVR]|uniref:SAF domain-containing protein n=1 Tax=Intrasporangium sp. DVR TaxID=3127867 RepID=UPI00334021D9